MPKISVIVPVYNVEQYLPQCLDSIINQTFQDIEIICINDGSTDNSGKVLEKYAQKDDRIKILTQKNQGQAVARNRGLSIATGEYIYFVDSDDFIHPQTLEIMYSVAEKVKSPIVATERVNQLSKNQKNTTIYQINDVRYNLHKNPLKHILNHIWSSSIIWNKLYKRDVLNGWKFIEGICFEDWPFITCLFSSINEYITIPYALYFYNDENTSTIRSTFTSKKLQDYITGIRFTHQYFQAKDKIKYSQIVRKKRISASVKMMINKVHRETVNHNTLVIQLKTALCTLRNEGIFHYRDLPVKSMFRFLKMYIRGY